MTEFFIRMGKVFFYGFRNEWNHTEDEYLFVGKSMFITGIVAFSVLALFVIFYFVGMREGRESK